MVPDDEPTLEGIVKYSQEFNAGAFGMMIARGDFRNGYDEIADDAVDQLDEIDFVVAGGEDGNTEGLNDIEDVTAISITEVMKAVKISTNQSSTLDFIIDNIRQDPFERTFWAILHQDNLPKDAQKFLLNVFYDSITPEALSMIMDCSPDEISGVECQYSKTLIYVDMPLRDIVSMEVSVTAVNEIRGDGSFGDVKISKLTGVAAIGTSVNDNTIRTRMIQIASVVICDVINCALTLVPIAATPVNLDILTSPNDPSPLISLTAVTETSIETISLRGISTYIKVLEYWHSTPEISSGEQSIIMLRASGVILS
jgi:hypothetical protein